MKLVILAVLLSFCALSVNAQQRKPRPAPAPAGPPPRIDLTADRLPPRLDGMNLPLIAQAYVERNAKAEKKEFETSEEQQARADTLDAELIKRFGSFRQNYFSVKPEVAYDADQGIFELRQTVKAGRLLHTGITRKAARYVGENAFGGKRAITGYVIIRYMLQLENIPDLPLVTKNTLDKETERFARLFDTQFYIRFSLSRDEAAKAKENIRLLYIGEILDPLVKHETEESKPTITEPTHEYYDETSVYFKLTEVILYDYPTGRIWHRWKPEKAPPTAPEKPAAPTTTLSPPKIVAFGTPVSPSAQSGSAGKPPEVSTGPYEMGRNGIGRIQILYKEKAKYTKEARDNKVQGTVVLNALFNADGAISDIRIIRGLSYGLDVKAIEAAQKVRFKPAEKDGKPVSVRGNLELTFNLY